MVCTRIGSGDDFEHNISSFMLEMKETAYICKRVTEKSLVLVDELGRATSNEDGISIAWAVGEHLLKTKAYSFFVTHYGGLCKLQDLYGNVNSVSFGKSGGGGGVLDYDHKLTTGRCNVSSSYGIDMAAKCGWPTEVINTAHTVRDVIVEKNGGDGDVKLDIGLGVKELEMVEAVEELGKKLILLQGGALGDAAMREFLGSIAITDVDVDVKELKLWVEAQ